MFLCLCAHPQAASAGHISGQMRGATCARKGWEGQMLTATSSDIVADLRWEVGGDLKGRRGKWAGEDMHDGGKKDERQSGLRKKECWMLGARREVLIFCGGAGCEKSRAAREREGVPQACVFFLSRNFHWTPPVWQSPPAPNCPLPPSGPLGLFLRRRRETLGQRRYAALPETRWYLQPYSAWKTPLFFLAFVEAPNCIRTMLSWPSPCEASDLTGHASRRSPSKMALPASQKPIPVRSVAPHVT